MKRRLSGALWRLMEAKTVQQLYYYGYQGSSIWEEVGTH